jgi:tetratricopeptide (TPR) repeat protein
VRRPFLIRFILSVALFSSATALSQEGIASGAGFSPASASPTQLNETVRTLEEFFRRASPQTSKPQLVHARIQLATAYLMLHCYRDSLDTLQMLHLGNRADEPAQAWTVKGLDELELNYVEDAVLSLRRAVRLNPASPTARLALGDALARSDHMQDAARVYEEQTRLTPNLSDAWYKLGLAHAEISASLGHAPVRQAEEKLSAQLDAEELLAKGDNLNAARTLLRVQRTSSDQPEIHADLGTALLALGYARAADDQFHQELVKNPESPSAWLGIAQAAALAGRWDAVAKAVDRLAQSNPLELTRLLQFPPSGMVQDAWKNDTPHPPESFSASAVGNLWRNWVGGAEVARISTAEGRPPRPTRCSQTATSTPGVWLTQLCYDTLEKQLRRGMELSLNQRRKLAEAEFRLGHYHAALHSAMLLHAADAHGGWSIYWLRRAHAAIAEECFLRVAALNPDSARVHQMLADHYMQLTDYPRAHSEYQNAIRLAPDLPELRLGLGRVLSRSGDFKAAESELQKTLQLAPQSDFAHYELGHVYVKQARWGDAILQLRQVRESSSAFLSARLDLAQAEAETEETPAAIRDLASVTQLDRDGEVYFRLASLYRKLGDEPRARDALTMFKHLRASSLDAEKDELGALELEQVTGTRSPP